MIWDDIHKLKAHLDIDRNQIIVLTSGGYDCLHCGHGRCIISSSELGNQLIVVVNGDNFLLRKKGYIFMPLAERMEIISYLRGVSHVVAWDDGTQYVAGALAILKPNLFTKGGDRSTLDAIAESERKVCEEIECRIVLGVGGSNKAQSSSALIKGRQNVVNFHPKENIQTV